MCSLFFLLLTALAQQAQIPGCRATEEVREAIQAARKAAEDDKRPSSEIQTERTAKLKALLEKHPGDFFVRRAYLEASRVRSLAPEEVIAEQKRRLGQGPEDPAAQYFYALALMGRQTAESIKILTKLATEHPKFARPFASLADIYGYPAFRDEAKLESNARAYARLCPENLDGYSRLSRLPNSEFLKEAAGRLRKLIAGRTTRRWVPGRTCGGWSSR